MTLDPILARSLLAFAVGLLLILVGLLIDPPLRIIAAINTED